MRSGILDHDGTGLIADPMFFDDSTATARQRSRYMGIIRVTLEHLRKKGFDQTKIQHIADGSGVALATVYRYFKSRDKLIYVATQAWITRTTAQALPSKGNRRIEGRLIRMIRASAKKLIEEPRLLEAWVRANLSTDPEVVVLIRERRLLDSLTIFPLEDMHDPILLNDLNLMADHVWFSGITRWAFGQKDYDEVYADVERVTLMVLNAHRSSPDLK